jgi:DNA-binding HxlR family transcriptional regulator
VLPRNYANQNCSIARSLEILGDRWTLLVVRCALVGVTRFDDFGRRLDIADNVLSDRLARLTDEGILERRAYQERPVRHEYLVTDKGRQLWPVLTALVDWGDRYYAPNGPPRILIHEHCGGQVLQHLVCGACDAHLSPGDISTRPGPGGGPRRVVPAAADPSRADAR